MDFNPWNVHKSDYSIKQTLPMSLNISTITAMTHKSHDQSSSGWAQPSLAPILALRTRRDPNRVNGSSQFSVPMINTLVTATLLSPSWLQRQVDIRLLGLHRRRRRAGSSALRHDLPPDRVIKERVYLIRSCTASQEAMSPHRPRQGPL